MKTYGGSGGIATPFLTSALDGGEWSASSPGRFTPREISPLPIGYEPVWTLRRSEKFTMPGIEPGPSSPSLYRLSYSELIHVLILFCHSRNTYIDLCNKGIDLLIAHMSSDVWKFVWRYILTIRQYSVVAGGNKEQEIVLAVRQSI
jgi:hypothetical protein